MERQPVISEDNDEDEMSSKPVSVGGEAVEGALYTFDDELSDAKQAKNSHETVSGSDASPSLL